MAAGTRVPTEPDVFAPFMDNTDNHQLSINPVSDKLIGKTGAGQQPTAHNGQLIAPKATSFTCFIATKNTIIPKTGMK